MSTSAVLPEATPPAQGLELHRRLMAGDVTAPSEIAETFLPTLVEYMQDHYPWADDPHLPQMAAIDALQSYLQRPEQFDPSKLSLAAYLRMAAHGDLGNAMKKGGRELKAQGGSRVVELDAPDAEYKVESESGLGVEERVEILLSPVWSRLFELLPDRADLQMVLLMMEDVRETSSYADVLGITDWPAAEQAREVKRHKDRLKKRLQRHMPMEQLDND